MVRTADREFCEVSPGAGFLAIVVDDQLDDSDGNGQVLGLLFLPFPGFDLTWMDFAEIDLTEFFKQNPIVPNHVQDRTPVALNLFQGLNQDSADLRTFFYCAHERLDWIAFAVYSLICPLVAVGADLAPPL